MSSFQARLDSPAPVATGPPKFYFTIKLQNFLQNTGDKPVSDWEVKFVIYFSIIITWFVIFK